MSRYVIDHAGLSSSLIKIDVIMNSGQVFGIDKLDKNTYRVLSADKCCIIKTGDRINTCYYRKNDFDYWDDYFNILSSTDIWKARSSDHEFLRKCAEYAEGMVILKQDLWETLISFIISQRKSIPAIKTCLNKFREKFGKVRAPLDMLPYFTFPTAEELKDITLDDLQDLGLGYRDKYILDAIRWWNQNYESYKEVFQNTDRNAHMALLKQINGVGDKVANCVCLFALNDLDAFPVDVWIQRALDKGLFTMDEIEQYKDKGVIQQIIFFYVINHKEEFK